jgi:hypothetical protein
LECRDRLNSDSARLLRACRIVSAPTLLARADEVIAHESGFDPKRTSPSTRLPGTSSPNVLAVCSKRQQGETDPSKLPHHAEKGTTMSDLFLQLPAQKAEDSAQLVPLLQNLVTSR